MSENGKTNEIRKEINVKSETIRLKSFAPPRDYSLGGSGRGRGRGRGITLDIERSLGRGIPINKKVFAPNLNAVRNKNTNVKTSKDTSTQGKSRSDFSKSDRGRKRGGLIQTTGVFSEGAGALKIKKPTTFRSYSNSKSRDDNTPIKRPTFTKTELLDPKNEALLIEQLLNDSDGENDEKTDFDNIVPITLNNDKWLAFSKKFKVEKLGSDKCEPKVDESSDNCNRMPSETKVNSQINSNLEFASTTDEIFTSVESKLFLLQLPDSLPCAEDNPADMPSTSKTIASKDTNGSSLRELREGQIGKMVRYKSGKCKLILGETVLDLDVGMETGFLQNVMSINTNQEERNGNMINIGPIQVKLTATPDWETLFKNS